MQTLSLPDSVTNVVGDVRRTGRPGLPALPIFDEAVLSFFQTLSDAILSYPSGRSTPNALAFGAWCRRSTLERQRSRYPEASLRLGRGLAVHLCPENVPTMFAYSVAAGLLSGNANIARLPTRTDPASEFLCARLSEVLASPLHASLADYLCCIRYDSADRPVTDRLCALSDARIIWGGDAKINEIRRSPISPEAVELTFPDRESILLIDSEAWLACHYKDRVVEAFYTDTYQNEQQACSAPRLIVWLGPQHRAAQERFWPLVQKLVEARHNGQPIMAVRKLEQAQFLLATQDGLRLESSGAVTRLWCEVLRAELLEDHPGGGLFLEGAAPQLEAIRPLLRSKCQTIAYFGVAPQDIAALVVRFGARGCQRIVPVGRTMEFSFIWDGHDMIRALSREIVIVDAKVEPRRP
jgi:hypothetical protein